MPSRDYNSWRLQKLSDPERAAKYLKAALESSTEDFFYALKNVIQARQVSEVAKKAGVKRESLYRVGNPTWDTLKSVLEALDLRFSGIEPISASAVSVPPVGSLGQRTKPLSRGRKRRKRSIDPGQQLSFRYEQSPIMQIQAATASTSAISADIARIGATVNSTVNQGNSGAFQMSQIEPFLGSYPGFYGAQNHYWSLANL